VERSIPVKEHCWREVGCLGAILVFAVAGSVSCSRPDAGQQPRDSAPAPPEEKAEARSPEPAPTGPDVLLITIDTLRADHVSAYGHGKPTTPFVDSLARRGVRYDTAYSTSSWTVPALSSLLTSTYGHRHGMDQRGGGRGRARWSVFPGSLVTLPEVLQQAGYATFGLTANFSLPPERGFGRGFDRYECVGAKGVEGVRPVFDSWLEEIGRARPWFVWLHLFDPHAPYLARKRWLPELWPEPRKPYPDLDALPPGELYPMAPTLDGERMDYVRALYDSEIREADDFVREVFQKLPGADDALFVLSSDHGEEFLEHEGMGHGRTLFEESVRVPLVVKYPDDRRAGTISKTPVSIIDIYPTILAAVGLDVPDNLDGRDLTPARDDKASEPRWLLAELRSSDHLVAITDGRWKLVRHHDAPTNRNLFDLTKDPGEKTDLSGKLSNRVKTIEAALTKARAAKQEAASDTAITPEQLEALKALGYMD
jgi:arylsulfatase A-like enzyme